MPDRRYIILSTASIPFERIPRIPDNVDLQIIPFIEIVAREEESLRKQIIRLAGEKRTVVFTSAHAVRWVAGLLTKKPDWKIYCIRFETRIALINWLGETFDLKTGDNAKILSERILADGIQEVDFFCGDQRMDILPDQLRKKGVQLNEYIVYDTRLIPASIKNQPDAILFFSPTAVKSFFSMNNISPATKIFSMGQTTAAALKNFTGNPLVVSTEADKTFVIKMALEYAGTHPVI